MSNEAQWSESEILKNKLNQREAELAIISSVSEAISQQLDISSITKIIGDKVREIFRSEVTEILLLEKETNLIHIPYSYYRDYQDAEAFLLGEGLTSKIIKSRKPLVLGSFEEQEKLGVIAHNEEEKTETYIGVPIIIGENVLGVVSIQSYKKNDYDAEKVKLLTILSTNMGTAIQNAKLFEETSRLLIETEQRSAELAIINSVGEAMSKELDVTTVTKIVGDKVKEIFKAEVTEILLLNKETNMISVPYSFYRGYETVEPFELGTGLTSKVIHSRKPLLLGDYIQQQEHGAIIDTNIGDADITETYLGIPILFNDNILGVVSIQSYKRNAYTESDVRLLTTLSANMGIALQNARLFVEAKTLLSETQQRNAELAILNGIQEGLVEELNFNSIIKIVGDKFREALGLQDIGIRIYDKEKNTLHFPYEYEHGEPLIIPSGDPTPYSRYVIETGKALILNKNTEEEASKMGITGSITIPGTDKSKSLIMVPIIVGNETKGLIRVENYQRENAFSDSEVRLLTTVANTMSMALENARLFDETNRLLDESKKRAAELGSVNSISQAIAGHLEIDKLIYLVGEKVRTLFNAGVVYLALLDKENNVIHFPYGYGDEYPPLPLGEGLTSQIILKKQPLLINNEVGKKTEELGVERIGTHASSYLGVPIFVGEEIIGVLSVQSTEQENIFNMDDMRLLSTIAAHVGIAINNANSYKRLNKTLDDLQATQNQLIQSEKMASLGELTAGIAHEIQNPLNFVNNFAEVNTELIEELKQELAKGNVAEVAALIHDIEENEFKINHHGKRADAIVKGMLQHSRSSSGKKEPTDINALADEYLRLAYHGLRAKDKTFNATMQTDYDPELKKVNVIPQEIGRVILNLITNAFYVVNEKKKHTGDGYEPTVTVKTKQVENATEVTVADNGNGIPQKILDKIFQPFFTTKPTGQGTGLGLSLSYDIVKAHGGDLTVSTKENIGSTFIVRLPN